MQIRVIRSIEELEMRSSAWDGLLRLIDNTNPFFTLDWIRGWWRFFGKGRGMYILEFYDEAGTAGFLPLMTEKKRLCTEYKPLTFPQGSFAGFIVAPGCEEICVTRAVEHLRGIRQAIIRLENMQADSLCCRLLVEKLADAGVDALLTTIPSRIVRLDKTTKEQYFERIKRHRNVKEVIKSENALSQAVTLTFDPAAPEEVEQIFPLHEKRWSHKNDGNGFGKGVSRSFFSHMAEYQVPGLPTSFRVLVHLLKAGDSVIGFSYDIECNGHLTCYRIAHDDDYAIYRPGLIVVKKTMEKYFDLGCHTIDFSKGDERYKRYWAEETVDIASVTFVSGAFLPRICLAFKRLFACARRHMKKIEPIAHFKRVTLGKIKHFLTGQPVKAAFDRLRVRFRQRGASGVIEDLAAPFVRPFACVCLYAVKFSGDSLPPYKGFSLKTASLDEAIELCDQLMIKPDICSKRYKSGHVCRLLYSKKELIGSVWVTDKHITSGKRVLWKPARPSQRCFFDMQLFKRCGADRYEQAVLCLVSPSLPKKCPSFFLLNQLTNRKIAHIADRLFEKLGTPHLAEKTEEKKGKSA